MRDQQVPLFEVPTEVERHWIDMPEFHQDDLMPWQTVRVHFRNQADRQAFANLVGQRLTPFTKSFWYPVPTFSDRNKADPLTLTSPAQPIYVISKNRWESRLTSKALERLRVPYHVVIEPQEYEDYAAVIDPAKILVLPFSNLGQGSIPARNWVWEHSIEQGATWHWILDDNIDGFVRLVNNEKRPVDSGAMFRAVEDFVTRYDNVALAGPNYRFFAKQRQIIPAYYLNTRVYSCILIRNDLPYRWRGRYNEDTDLCLRALKDGWCTVLFNAFLANKAATMTIRGGNTDELYKDDGRLKMAESLRDQHPDIVTVTTKWGRPQHQVDYSVFKQKLILRQAVMAL